MKYGRDCDFVVCLTHLDEKEDDVFFDEQKKTIDVCLGGHNHTPYFREEQEGHDRPRMLMKAGMD